MPLFCSAAYVAATQTVQAMDAQTQSQSQAKNLKIQLNGVKALKLFGYDLFQKNESGFDPPMAGTVAAINTFSY